MTFKEALSIFSKTNTTKKKEDISWLVWLIENPKSPFHLHGAVTLHDHDHIHVLLGRGQANDDEAFVIGFTMGNDDRTKSWESKLFKFISRWLYSKSGRFTKKQLKIFDSGFKYGRSKLNLYQRIGEEAKAQKDFQSHIKCSRKAIMKARVLILTLGLTEIWEDKSDQSVICLPSGPYFNEGGGLDEYVFRVSRYQENLDNLEKIYQILKKHNKECKLVITVSPVHLWATFRKDMDVISANCNSKSTLRAAADEFTSRHDDVYYFPSYEIATSFTMMMNQTCFEKGKENFHINKETVEQIMKHFFKFYSKGGTH